MTDDLPYAVALLGAGLASGFAGGLFGIGGGIVRVPILLYLLPAFGVDPQVTMHVAAGTSLAVAVPGTVSACHAQYRAGHLDLDFLRTWIPALLVGVLVGLGVQRWTPGHVLTLVFACVMVVQALQMWIGRDRLRLRDEMPQGAGRWTIAGTIGALSVMLGISGGVFTTPTLVAMSFPLRRALAVSTATAMCVAAVGAAGGVVNGIGSPLLPRFSVGYVDLLGVAAMLPAVLLTSPLGVRVANRTNQDRLARAFALLMLAVAADMMLSFLHARST